MDLTKGFDTDILHDSVLEKICFTWEKGLIEIFIKINRQYLNLSESNEIQLLLRQATYLNVENHNPWGKSVYINEVTLNRNGVDSIIIIEMQSGDKIEISYNELEVISLP